MSDFSDPAIVAELERQRLGFLRGRKPNLLLPVPASTKSRLRALQLFHQGKFEAGLEHLEEANMAGEAFEGTVDGRQFEGWRDEDDWLGDTLEIVAAGKIHWLPLSQIQMLKLPGKPALEGGLFLPAEVRLVNREELKVWLPIRYVQSLDHPEPDMQSAEDTDLYADEVGCTRCLGLRSWLIGMDGFTPWEFSRVEKRSDRIGLV